MGHGGNARSHAALLHLLLALALALCRGRRRSQLLGQAQGSREQWRRWCISLGRAVALIVALVLVLAHLCMCVCAQPREQ